MGPNTAMFSPISEIQNLSEAILICESLKRHVMGDDRNARQEVRDVNRRIKALKQERKNRK